jgi:hypothetical protein
MLEAHRSAALLDRAGVRDADEVRLVPVPPGSMPDREAGSAGLAVPNVAYRHAQGHCAAVSRRSERASPSACS